MNSKKKIFKKLICILMFLFFSVPAVNGISHHLNAETIEEMIDKEMMGSKSGNETTEIKDNDSRWKINGFLESSNFFYVPDRDKDMDEEDKYGIIKLESHGRLDAKYGNESYYGKAVMDLYFYQGAEDEDSSNNWKAPRDTKSIEAQELYLKGGDKLQFRIGKQLFSWGTADMFQIMNYFDQPDQREFFAIDRDERYEGIPALSLKLLLGNFSIEIAGTPVHSPTLMPEQGSFWAINTDPLNTPAGNIPVVMQEANSLDSSINNGSYAVRAGGTVRNLDFHLSYFNGINNNILYQSRLTGTSTADASISMQPYYNRIQAFGLDLAFTVDKLSVRGEAVYSPDMIAIKEPDPVRLQTGLTQLMMSMPTDIELSEVEKEHYCAYTVGADYNLWGNNGLILVEWMQNKYLKNEDNYSDPFLNKMLYIRIEDKFFNESLEAETGLITRPVDKEFGYAITGELTWNFKNGFTAGAGGFFFVGKNDELFSSFDDKDAVFVKARMEF